MKRRKKRRPPLHPIIREIAKRQSEIRRLVAAARMIGVDLSPVMPVKHRVGAKRAAAYHSDQAETMRQAFPAPLNDAIPEELC